MADSCLIAILLSAREYHAEASRAIMGGGIPKKDVEKARYLLDEASDLAREAKDCGCLLVALDSYHHARLAFDVLQHGINYLKE